jgi:hypothetical protein
MQALNKQAKPDFSQALDYTCEQCGNTAFVAQYLIKKFSALLSPTGEEMLAPIQVFGCAKCGHINSDFIPENDQMSTL